MVQPIAEKALELINLAIEIENASV